MKSEIRGFQTNLQSVYVNQDNPDQLNSSKVCEWIFPNTGRPPGPYPSLRFPPSGLVSLLVRKPDIIDGITYDIEFHSDPKIAS